MRQTTIQPGAINGPGGDIVLGFRFSPRNRIEPPLQLNTGHPVIESIETPSEAQTYVHLRDGQGRLMLTPLGFTYACEVPRLSYSILQDKLDTATGYLGLIFDGKSRRFNAAVSVGGTAPLRTFRNHEDTIRQFGQETFDLEGEKRTLGSNQAVSIEYRNGTPIII